MAHPAVVIVGGGPTGLAAGLSCVAAGCGVTILERDGFDRYRPGEHLSGRGRRALEALGIPEETVAAVVRETFAVESRWGDARLRSRDSIFDTHGPGWLISRPAFDRALVECARRRGAEIRTETSVRRLTRRGRQWEVATATGELRADVIIDASGRQSTLGRQLGARPAHYDQLVGLTATCQIRRPLGAILVESVAHGWWYSAVLPDDRLVLTYMTDADLVRAQGGPAEAWAKALPFAQGAHERWAGCALPAQVHVRSATTRLLDRVVGPGWLIIGDAAFARDPLSSEGITVGLEDGLAAGRLGRVLAAGGVPSTDHHRRVVGYLRSRAAVYGREARWSRHAFWQRRHRPVWATASLNIKPETRLVAPDADRLRRLGGYCPGLDVSGLTAALARGSTAGEVALAYSKLQVGQSFDRELVAGLQFLSGARSRDAGRQGIDV